MCDSNPSKRAGWGFPLTLSVATFSGEGARLLFLKKGGGFVGSGS